MNAVAFSPDGTRVASAGDDQSARVFDAATGATVARFDHDESVEAVVFSRDGSRLITGSGRLVRVFDAATGNELARLDHDATVRAVAFSPDGTRAATIGVVPWARVFELEPAAVMRQAVVRMTRPLNEQERRRYGLPPDAAHVKLWQQHQAPR